jgi:NAD(P)-dependent dehydrogenase (short-subunit alcohol dehydrogenase family)
MMEPLNAGDRSKMNLTLTGKVAVVTGVGACIGAAVADIFAAAGARVVGLECNAQALSRTVISGSQFALGVDGSAKFSAPDNQSFVE